jgi:hypothetical protein
MPVEVQGRRRIVPRADQRSSEARFRRWLETERSALILTAVVVVGIAAAAGLVGADARWLAALGDRIAGQGSIPRGVPFAAAPTADWHNAIVFAELLFHWLEAALGDRGVVLAQLAAVLVAVVALTRDARAEGAGPKAAGAAVMLTALGAVASIVIARVQLFSLALFPLLVLLLRSEYRRPSARIWLVVPFVALWSNLHGAVLIGLAVTYGYLVLARLRRDPLVAVGVGAAALAALCVTPAGPSTLAYYHGVLTNEAAARGAGLWAPLTLTKPLDVLLLVVAVALAAEAWRAKPPLWEVVVAIGLAVETVQASRSGVWLLLFLAPRAAIVIRSTAWWNWIMPPLAVIAFVALLIGVVRGPLPSGASSAMVARAISLAHGTPILASDVIDEQVPLAGGRIWVGNPIDAFTKSDQSSYLDWLAGNVRGRRALAHGIDVVLTTPASAAAHLMASDPQFSLVQSNRRGVLYVRLARP